MTISKRRLLATITALGLAGLAQRSPAAQGECLHGTSEDAAQRGRRSAAVRLVRQINTAEMNGPFRQAATFKHPSELGVDLASAPGFEASFVTDGKAYSLMLADTLDACHFVVSTNQNGVIFQGYPIDYDVQPVKR